MKCKTLRKNLKIDTIQKWLKDSDCDVRQAAMNACAGRDVIIRTIDPPDQVFKKCLNNVIVVAHIPDDAQIRGYYNQKCRANKAIITDIIGEFGGEKIGISTYDYQTCYFIGDEIEIDDFDMSQNVTALQHLL